MAIRKVIYLPDPRLRKKCELVKNFHDTQIQSLIDDMYETMYAANGVGLAANQIGICLQIAVINVTREKENQFCIINPEIIEAGSWEEMQEGCLSVPGTYNKVKRPKKIKIRAFNREGQPFEMEGEDLLAECLHHEIDHLNGIVYIDHLSALKRARALEQMKKHFKNKAERL